MKRGFGKEKVSPTVRMSCELLGVNAGASESELKKAYHKLALLYHPDRNPNAQAVSEFRKVTEAHELLSDPLRVAELNRKYISARFQAEVVEGFSLTFGSFFGYRLFQPQPSTVHKGALLKGRSDKFADQRASSSASSFTDEKIKWEPIEENNSILDHPAFDAIEVVYAGRLSRSDEKAIQGEVDDRKLAHLPWVMLNNEGLLKFLDGDLRRSGECYRKLCERVPNNIIFMYRYGLCLILEAFQNPKRSLFGNLTPDKRKLEKGIALLEHCVTIGEARSVGRQKCLVIRKVIADVRERMGQKRKANKQWQAVLDVDQKCVEATYKIKGAGEAERLLRKRKKHDSAVEAHRLLPKSPR